MSKASRLLFIRREARSDLEDAFDWYEARGAGLGHEFLRAVRVQLAAIKLSPDRFPVVADDIRKAVLRRFPYTIYFVILRRQISVIAVLHGRRHPSRWQSRR